MSCVIELRWSRGLVTVLVGPRTTRRCELTARRTTTIDVPSSHLAMVPHPKDVIRLTEVASDALAANR
jgi:hypothetical protein